MRKQTCYLGQFHPEFYISQMSIVSKKKEGTANLSVLPNKDI